MPATNTLHPRPDAFPALQQPPPGTPRTAPVIFMPGIPTPSRGIYDHGMSTVEDGCRVSPLQLDPAN